MPIQKNGFFRHSEPAQNPSVFKSLVLFKDRMVTNCLMQFCLAIPSRLPARPTLYHIGNAFASTYEAEVVGIYQVNQPMAPYMFGDTYRYEGEDILTKSLNAHRKNHVSLVFQEYNLIDYLTAVENVRLGGTDRPVEQDDIGRIM